MLKLKDNCKVCIRIKVNPKLAKRIYDSSYFIPHSKDSLRKIWLDCLAEEPGAFTYLSMTNHVKRHQHINAGDYNRKMLADKVKKVEMKIVESRFESMNVQDAVMNVGMEKLESGELKVTTNDLLRAAKDKFDGQAKVRDQQLALAEMVAFYASGEDNLESERIDDRRALVIEEYDPAVPITENSDSGSD